MLDKVSLDTIEELSNGFINKIVEIKEKLQGKDDDDQAEMSPKEEMNNIDEEAKIQESEAPSTSYFSFTGFFSSQNNEVHIQVGL